MKQFLLIFLFTFSFIFSQDKHLMKIGDNLIFPDEFLNIYNKNRTDADTVLKADEIDEYINLFINFKLKVIEAESLGMDTLTSFKKELAGYRNQLSKSYLNDTKVTEELLKEAYERLKYEINASHILITLDPSATPEDTLKAYNKINSIRKEFYNGASFETLAVKYSEDPSVANNKGSLGYFSALRMVYPFESAAYNTNKGEVSKPVRTSYGYHILKVNDIRNSRGDVKVAHIMLVKDKKTGSDSIARKKIYEIYNLLTNGDNFEDLAKKYSDDKKSGSKGGELDWFGVTNKVNMYETFSNASFNLINIGDISEPIKTPAGWHIIKLLDKKPLPSFTDIESNLKSRVEKDSRSQKSRDALIKRCKDFYSFEESKKYLNIFYKISSEDILQAKNSSDFLKKSNKNLFSLSFNETIKLFKQKDFSEFIINFKNSFRGKENSKLLIDELYRMFVEQSIINFENKNLELRYPEFSLLMDEYHDGILLFDLMNERVWSKAVKDTSGLNQFYNSLINNSKSEKYFNPERVVKKVYETYDENNNKKLLRYISRGLTDQLIDKKLNKESNLNLKIYEEVIPVKEISNFKSSYFSEGVFYLNVLTDTLKKSPKPLSEIKGLVISEYQNLLEEEWLTLLKKKYEIEINKNVLKLLKENRLEELINKDKVSKNIPEYNGSFSQAYRKAVRDLGSSKDNYFIWRGNVYTTE